MKKFSFLLLALSLTLFSCNNDDADPTPDALEIARIDAFVSTGTGTFQVTNLVANSPVSNLQLDSPFIVVFAKAVENDWLTNNSLPKLLRTENGNAVAGVNMTLTVDSPTQITLAPNQALEAGMTYQLVINAGYEATDGAVLEEPVMVDFTTAN